MTHLATADSDPAFAEQQVERFREATEPYADLMRHVANSAAALRLPSARFDAARCGVALYGLSPFGEDPAADGLEPALSWRSYLAQVKRLEPGESTGYGRRVRRRAADLDRDRAGRLRGRLSPRPDRHRGARQRRAAARGRRRSRWTPSRSSSSDEEPVGAPVTILGHGVLAEDHARVAGTINYELVCGINSRPAPRAADGRRCLSSRSEVLAGRGGLGRRRRRARRAARPRARRPRHRRARSRSAPPAPTRSASGGAPFAALGAARRLAGRARGRPHGRLHAAARLDRGRPGDARLHDQRDRPAARAAASRSIPSAGRPTSRRAGCARSARASSATTRCGCCARCGSRTSSSCGSTRRPSGSSRRDARARHAAGGRADPRRAAAALGRRLPPARRARPARAARRPDRRPARPLGLARLPARGGLRRRAPPLPGLERAAPLRRARCCGPSRPSRTPRSIHRFRRATEPWALEALAFLGASELAPAIERGARRRAGRAAAARRRARPAARPGDRPPARRDRGGAGRGYDRHEGGGARLCTTPRGSGSRRRLSGSPRCRTHARRSSRRRCSASSRRRATSGCSTPAAARARSPSRSLRTCARWSRVDLVPELLEQGRRRADRFPNVSFVEGDATSLPFELGAFDLAGSLRTLHHIARPELAVAELVRVTRPGGRVLVIDQIAPIDPAGRGRAERLRAGARPVAPRGCSRTSTCAACSSRTGSCSCAASRSASRGTSTPTSSSPAARARSAGARRRSRPGATPPSSAGTCSSA